MQETKRYIVKQCEECHHNHSVEQKEINRGFGKFCSRRCSALNRVKNLIPPEPNVKCARCGINFYLSLSKQKSKSGLYFCCREHKDEAQKVGGIQAIQPPHYGTSETNYRRIAFASKEKICERCGFSNEAAIIVHHKDRNRDNNTLSNLEVLCANCHAIEHLGESKDS